MFTDKILSSVIHSPKGEIESQNVFSPQNSPPFFRLDRGGGGSGMAPRLPIAIGSAILWLQKLQTKHFFLEYTKKYSSIPFK